jgi:DNA-binding protein HU-beta
MFIVMMMMEKRMMMKLVLMLSALLSCMDSPRVVVEAGGRSSAFVNSFHTEPIMSSSAASSSSSSSAAAATWIPTIACQQLLAVHTKQPIVTTMKKSSTRHRMQPDVAMFMSTNPSLDENVVNATAVDMKPKKKIVKVPTYKKEEFINDVAFQLECPSDEAEAIIDVVFETIQEQVNAGYKVSWPGVGYFVLKTRAARKGRNPMTGDEIAIPTTKYPSFTVAKKWKDLVKNMTSVTDTGTSTDTTGSEN